MKKKKTDNKKHLMTIAAHYNAQAKYYDDVYESVICNAENRAVARILSDIIDGYVLDIGSGSGLLCDLFDIDKYVGVDLSSEMIKIARKKHPDKHFIMADMHALPFEDNSFDTVVSLFGPLSYSTEPENLLQEIMRVSKPGAGIALMPYTLRAGKGLDIGGFSTLLNDDVRKIFYTESSLMKLLSPLDEVKVIGINYFLNTYNKFSSIMFKDTVTSDYFVDRFLEIDEKFDSILPAEFARHMIGIGIKPRFL